MPAQHRPRVTALSTARGKEGARGSRRLWACRLLEPTASQSAKCKTREGEQAMARGALAHDEARRRATSSRVRHRSSRSRSSLIVSRYFLQKAGSRYCVTRLPARIPR